MSTTTQALSWDTVKGMLLVNVHHKAARIIFFFTSVNKDTYLVYDTCTNRVITDKADQNGNVFTKELICDE